jgi:gamma-glutamyltranspeptidase / glutathione hydrolase
MMWDVASDVPVMDPAAWDRGEVTAAFVEGIDASDAQAVTGSGGAGMVIGSTGPFAQLAGRKALEAGGSAADAVLTTALAQVALAAGSWVSYAGVFTMVHYEAATEQVSSLSAGFATFAEETDPATIPAPPEQSGRTALVPGFMAGVAAAHQRFGRLAWPQLFAPAVFIAEHGFPVGTIREKQFALRADVLARTPQARAVFYHDDGSRRLRRGALFHQPALAATLDGIASGGVDWMYHGPWAQKFVDLVREHGGHAASADLARYQPIWAPPQQADFSGHQVHTVGLPDSGGTALVLALNLLSEAQLADPTADPEALYWLIQIARQRAGPPRTEQAGTSVTETDPDYARRLWVRMRQAGRFVGSGTIDAGIHSDFVLAADQYGNVAACCHSINTSLWGNTGLFVDGVSIPDAACFQQPLLASLGPGEHLPFPAQPAIALRDGQPVLACSSVGVGLQVATLQGLHATLALRVPVSEAVARPFFHGPDYLTGDTVTTPAETKNLGEYTGNTVLSEQIRRFINTPLTSAARFQKLATQAHATEVPGEDILTTVLRDMPQTIEDRFAPELLHAVRGRGQLLCTRPIDDPTLPRGFWGALSIHPDTPRLRGGRTPFSGGRVESH